MAGSESEQGKLLCTLFPLELPRSRVGSLDGTITQKLTNKRTGENDHCYELLFAIHNGTFLKLPFHLHIHTLPFLFLKNYNNWNLVSQLYFFVIIFVVSHRFYVYRILY